MKDSALQWMIFVTSILTLISSRWKHPRDDMRYLVQRLRWQLGGDREDTKMVWVECQNKNVVRLIREAGRQMGYVPYGLMPEGSLHEWAGAVPSLVIDKLTERHKELRGLTITNALPPLRLLTARGHRRSKYIRTNECLEKLNRKIVKRYRKNMPPPL